MRPRTLYLLVCGAFIAGRGWAHVLGMRFDDTPLEFYWQFLDSDILRHDLLRGVLDLHAQPPLFQLFVGGVLKLVPGHATSVFAAAYCAAASVAPCSLTVTAGVTNSPGSTLRTQRNTGHALRRLRPRRRVVRPCCH
jgi:hypothetical protein